MKKKKKTGQTRMAELGKVKVELWFSEAQAEALDNLTRLYGVKRATLARRFVNYLVAGGANYAKPASCPRFD